MQSAFVKAADSEYTTASQKDLMTAGVMVDVMDD
jgi:hypothetical protein